jgi:hypothetical protein
MKLLTVRLSAEDAERVKELRGRGVKISDLVRNAIAKESLPRERRIKKASDVNRVLEEIYAKYPDSPGRSSRGIDLTDRKAVARALRARWGRRAKT